MNKSILYRFLRGGIAGALAMILTVTFSGVTDWSSLFSVLNTAALVGVIGFITGTLMALDKYFRSTPIEG